MTALFSESQLVTGNQVDCDVLFEDGDVRLPANQAGQRVLNREAGRISDVDHAPGTVTSLAGQVVAVVITGKGNALRNQPIDGAPTVFDDEASRPRVIEKSASGDRVANVRFDRIAVIEHGRNATLRPTRSTVFEAALADQGHSAGWCQPKCRGLSSQTTANDENVEAKRQKGEFCRKGLQL